MALNKEDLMGFAAWTSKTFVSLGLHCNSSLELKKKPTIGPTLGVTTAEKLSHKQVGSKSPRQAILASLSMEKDGEHDAKLSNRSQVLTATVHATNGPKLVNDTLPAPILERYFGMLNKISCSFC